MSVISPTRRSPGTPEAAAEVPGRSRPVERRFRPDIEGLRAVAVLLVVLYHAKLMNVSGGYVGVDVFFVISGFLITRQLFETQQRRGRVRLSEFYIRRMKRLLPAAAVVTIAVLVAARVWSSTIAAKDIAKDAVFSALYGMNFHLAEQGTDYLTADKAASPLQHFWSLAVEEQFYIGLPLLILAAALVRARAQRAVLVAVIAAGVAYSLYLSITVTQTSAPDAYFSINTRAWELGLGSLVALLVPLLVRMPGILAAPLSWVGLGMIMYSAFAYSDGTAFPGTAALMPVGGCALVIAAGCRRARGSAEVLLGRWLAQMIGKISYSWYLWHWPALVFAPLVIGRALDTSTTLQVLFISLLLAVATYFQVELPGRRLTLHKPAWVLSGLGLSALTAAAALVFAATLPSLAGSGTKVEQEALASSSAAALRTVLEEGSRTRAVPANLTPSLEEAIQDYPQDGGCILKYLEVEQRECVRGDPKGDKTMVLFGDSHAGHWFGAFNAAAKELHWRLVVRNKAACPVASLTVNAVPLKRAYTECDQWRRQTVEEIVAMRPDLVVASQADAVPWKTVTDEVWATATKSTLRELKESGAKLLFLSDNPAAPKAPAECLAEHTDDAARCVFTRQTGYVNFPERRVVMAEMLTAAGFSVADTAEWLCGSRSCPVIVGKNLVYRDASHVSHTFSTWLAPVVRPFLSSTAAALGRGDK